MNHTGRIGRALVLGTAMVLVAAACGDDGDPAAEDGGAATTTVQVGESTTTAGEPDGGADGTDPTDGSVAPTEGSVEIGPDGRLVSGGCAEGDNNSDESIGVTGDSVNIAVVAVDYAPIVELGLAKSDVDVTAQAQVFIDAVNEAGGVCGRRIDLQPVLYDVIRREGGAACLEVTENRRNLLVFGQQAFTEALCVAEAGTVTYTEQDFSQAEVDQAGGELGLMFARNVSFDDSVRATVEHFLPDLVGQSVGVWYGSQLPSHGEIVESDVLPVLDEAGVDYVAFRTDFSGPTSPDGNAVLLAAASEFGGRPVDVVLGFTQAPNQVGMQSELAAQGATPQYLWSNMLANTTNDLFKAAYGVEAAADGERLLTYTNPTGVAMELDPVVSCNEQYAELTGNEPPTEGFDYVLIANMCHQVDMLVALLTIMGPEITQPALVQAFETLPRHPMGSILGDQQWGPGVRFGSSTMAELLYDGSTNSLSLNSEPFEVSTD